MDLDRLLKQRVEINVLLEDGRFVAKQGHRTFPFFTYLFLFSAPLDIFIFLLNTLSLDSYSFVDAWPSTRPRPTIVGLPNPSIQTQPLRPFLLAAPCLLQQSWLFRSLCPVILRLSVTIRQTGITVDDVSRPRVLALSLSDTQGKSLAKRPPGRFGCTGEKADVAQHSHKSPGAIAQGDTSESAEYDRSIEGNLFPRE